MIKSYYVRSDTPDNLLLSLARHISNWTYILHKTNVCHKNTAQIYSKSLTTLTLMVMVGSGGHSLYSCLVSFVHAFDF